MKFAPRDEVEDTIFIGEILGQDYAADVDGFGWSRLCISSGTADPVQQGTSSAL